MEGDTLVSNDTVDNDTPVSPLSTDATEMMEERSSPIVTELENIWSAPVSPDVEPPTSDTNLDGGAAMHNDENEIEDPHADKPVTPKYQLRPQKRDFKAAFTRTWMDKDESGNYGERDRNEDLRRARARRDRVKRRARTNTDAFDEDVADDEHSRCPKVKDTLHVILKFQGEATRAKYEDIIANLPARAECERSPKGYRLHTKLSRHYGECNLDKSSFAPELPDDLTGYPIARGCWECVGLGVRCPLLDDERSWPCATCLDDDNDCTLVTPPVLKHACERCKRRRTGCSYTHTFNHGEACQQCMDDGHFCVAGPAKDSIRPRIRYDRDWVNDPFPKTRTSKKPRRRSTILDADDKSDAVARHNDAVHQQHDVKEKPASNDSRPLNKSSKGTTTSLSTKFCHPIVFNHQNEDKEPCHFCAEASYAIFGLGTKEVEVIEWEDGRGLDEVSGGHKGEGVENTRVCASCTLQRLSIIMCPVHELRPIAGVKQDALDLNSAFAELLSGSPKTKKMKWCAICPNLASYECCSLSDSSAGCGLTVCEHCMVLLSGVYEGDLQRMLPELKAEPTEERMLGLRADYELLREDGLLMRYVLWNMQQK